MRKKIIMVLVAGIILLSYLDVYLTLTGVSRYGTGIEGNMTVKDMLDGGGTFKWILYKTFFSLLLIGFFLFSKKYLDRVPVYVSHLILLTPVFVLLLYVNIKWIIYLV